MLQDKDSFSIIGDVPSDSHQSSNLEANPNESSARKVECHCCLLKVFESSAVKCLNPDCPLSYCRPCLMRFHKFSRKIAKRLPSPAWRCPQCLNKCRCKKYMTFIKVQMCNQNRKGVNIIQSKREQRDKIKRRGEDINRPKIPIKKQIS